MSKDYLREILLKKYKPFHDKIKKYFEDFCKLHDYIFIIHSDETNIIMYAYKSIKILLVDFREYNKLHKLNSHMIRARRKLMEKVIVNIDDSLLYIEIYNIHLQNDISILHNFKSNKLIYLHHIVNKLAYPTWYPIMDDDIFNFCKIEWFKRDKTSKTTVRYKPYHKVPYRYNSIYLFSYNNIDYYILGDNLYASNFFKKRRFRASDQLLRSRMYLKDKYKFIYPIEKNMSILYNFSARKHMVALPIMRLKYLILEHIYEGYDILSDIKQLYTTIMNSTDSMFNGISFDSTKDHETSYRKYYKQLQVRRESPWSYTFK